MIFLETLSPRRSILSAALWRFSERNTVNSAARATSHWAIAVDASMRPNTRSGSLALTLLQLGERTLEREEQEAKDDHGNDHGDGHDLHYETPMEPLGDFLLGKIRLSHTVLLLEDEFLIYHHTGCAIDRGVSARLKWIYRHCPMAPNRNRTLEAYEISVSFLGLHDP